MSKEVIGFTGSRKGFYSTALVSRIARAVSLLGHTVCVGCAQGVDSVVRSAVPSARVFSVASPGAGVGSRSWSVALARRSQSMVSACSVLVGFASVPCPSSVSPARSFCGGGSGTWASIAFAVGRGLRVFVFAAPDVPLPSWSGGSWVQACPTGTWAAAWVWLPTAAVSQLSLL
jgi:hypothetical protein